MRTESNEKFKSFGKYPQNLSSTHPRIMDLWVVHKPTQLIIYEWSNDQKKITDKHSLYAVVLGAINIYAKQALSHEIRDIRFSDFSISMYTFNDFLYMVRYERGTKGIDRMVYSFAEIFEGMVLKRRRSLINVLESQLTRELDDVVKDLGYTF